MFYIIYFGGKKIAESLAFGTNIISSKVLITLVFLWLQLSVYDAHMSFVVLQTFNNFRTYFFHVCIKKEKCTFAVPHKL